MAHSHIWLGNGRVTFFYSQTSTIDPTLLSLVVA